MTTEIRKGARVFHPLVPFDVPTGRGDEVVTVEVITMKPCTWHTTRKWLAGEYNHPDGMIPGLMEEVTGMTHEALGYMQYPDTDTFMAEFMTHVPTTVREMIANGEYPDPQLNARIAREMDEPPAYRPSPAPQAQPAPPPPEQSLGISAEYQSPTGETVYRDDSAVTLPAADGDPIPAVPGALYGLDLSDGRDL